MLLSRLSADPNSTRMPSRSCRHASLHKMTIGLVIEGEKEGIPNRGEVSSAPAMP